MILMDVNVLVYAHREGVRDHHAYREWLESVINSNTAYAYSELVLSGLVRVVTHPRIFERPSSLDVAIAFTEQIRAAPQAVGLLPGNNHWEIFLQCLKQISAKGNDVADAYQAALALEWGCDWVTTSRSK